MKKLAYVMVALLVLIFASVEYAFITKPIYRITSVNSCLINKYLGGRDEVIGDVLCSIAKLHTGFFINRDELNESYLLWAVEGAINGEFLNKELFEESSRFISTLAERGQNLDLADECGKVVLHDAVNVGSPRTVKLLIGLGADPNFEVKAEGCFYNQLSPREFAEELVRKHPGDIKHRKVLEVIRGN